MTTLGRTTSPVFLLDGYQFRFLSVDEESYDLSYPKQLALIGVNHETRTIICLYVTDPDVDSISNMEYYLNTFCGWNYIR